jgi:glycosyltransferase involved in cell wall biosynthesis
LKPAQEVKVWYASQKGGRNIEKLIEKGDVLFINSIFSHHFDYLKLLQSAAHRKIVSPRGMLDPGSLSQKWLKKILYLLYWRLRGFHHVVEWHATSEQEKKNIYAIFGSNVKVWLVPNLPKILEYQPQEKVQKVLRLTTIALISPMKNHLLVLKALRHVGGTVHYDIYGPIKDKSYWESCQQVIKQLPSNIQVTYHGNILPDKIQGAYKNVHITVQPSKSENFGHSLFESLTAGKPIITSHNTPWNNLEKTKAGMNVSIDDETDIAKAIGFFAAMNQDEYIQWGACARDHALKAIDLDEIKKGYLEMFGISAHN